jgi:hypothetical protein
MDLEDSSAQFSQKLQEIILGAHLYRSPYAKTVGNPREMAETIIQEACMKTTAISSTLSLAPGLLNYATIVPEIFLIYRIKAHLVKDIAALYGKEHLTSKEVILYCMFKNRKESVLKQFIFSSGSKLLIRPMTIRFMEEILEQLGFEIKRKSLKKLIYRWIPIVGSLTTGLFSFLDTRYVGVTACRVFEKEIRAELAK